MFKCHAKNAEGQRDHRFMGSLSTPPYRRNIGYGMKAELTRLINTLPTIPTMAATAK